MLDLTQVTETITILPTKAKRKQPLVSVPVCVDTETSKHVDYDNEGNVTDCYGWIYLYGIEFGGAYGEGRTPSEFLDDIERIRDEYGCTPDGVHLVVYIHNLSFDVQYLKDFLLSRYGGDYDMLAVAPHKFISFKINAFEFRCSYKLSNRSLDKWAKDLGVEHQKAVGEIDYNEKHYQDDELSESQHHYQRLDVLTLKDCLYEQMRLFGDNLQTIPLTSTGYVRREVRKNFRNEIGAVERFRKTRLTCTTYVFCRREFSGGLTHGNRHVAGEIVKANPEKNISIRHRDFVSHYPTQQRARLWGFPKGKFQLWYRKRPDRNMTLDECLKYAEQRCLLVEIAIHNLRIKPGVTLPYAQSCKFIDGKLSHGWVRPIEDNGRILEMKGTSVVVMNELDLTILLDQYTFQYNILRVYSATRGAIPDYLKTTIDYYFGEKTRLKNLKEKLKREHAPRDEIRTAERDLQVVKALLNAIYGCTATCPVRTSFFMDTNGNWSEEELTDTLLEDKLDKFYHNYNSCMPYQLGCWTTSLARYQLWFVISKVIGYDHFLYCDTDSAFYISTPEVEKRLEEYNRLHREQAEKHGAFVEVDGERSYYDNFGDEGENITEFVFLHAKAYAYKTDDGELHVTIAGVKDKSGDITREQELGSIKNFKSGTVFRACGGTRSIYVEGKPHHINEDGHDIELAGSVVLENVTKTLNAEFERVNPFYETDIDDGNLL